MIVDWVVVQPADLNDFLNQAFDPRQLWNYPDTDVCPIIICYKLENKIVYSLWTCPGEELTISEELSFQPDSTKLENQVSLKQWREDVELPRPEGYVPNDYLQLLIDQYALIDDERIPTPAILLANREHYYPQLETLLSSIDQEDPLAKYFASFLLIADLL